MRIIPLAVSAGLLLGAAGCSGAHPAAGGPATTNLSVSDRATCVGPAGPFAHVWITIKDVQASTSASSSAGFVDLTPNLAQKPVQIDLLGTADGQCLLAQLGSSTALAPGTYLQFRLVLEDNGSGGLVPNNACSSVTAANCVTLTAGGTFAIQITSEAQTGITIPATQIAGGQFVVAAGVTKDLDLDFSACASVVTVAAGQFRLKPALHVGEVSLLTGMINGTVVDKVSGNPVAGGNVMVALEQKDALGIDRVVMATNADSAGRFVFCPVPAGIYDVVAVAVSGANLDYAATVTESVPTATAMGTVPVIAEATAVTAPGTISGAVSTSTGNAGTSADITLSALQAAGSGSGVLTFTMPLVEQASPTASLATVAGNACATNADCARFTFLLPAAPATLGTFDTGGTNYVAGTGSATYMLEADAAVPMSGGTPDCTPASVTTNAVTLAPSANVNAGMIFFGGCQ